MNRHCELDLTLQKKKIIIRAFMEDENVANIFGSTLFRSVICYPGKVIHLKNGYRSAFCMDNTLMCYFV